MHNLVSLSALEYIFTEYKTQQCYINLHATVLSHSTVESYKYQMIIPGKFYQPPI